MPVVNCKHCNNELYVKPSHLINGFGKYCSQKCNAEAHRKGKYVECHICIKQIWRMPAELNKSKSKLYFCSRSCSTKWRNVYFSGDKHANWKSGGTIYKKILIKTENEVKCNSCGTEDKRILVAHHIDKDRKITKQTICAGCA